MSGGVLRTCQAGQYAPKGEMSETTTCFGELSKDGDGCKVTVQCMPESWVTKVSDTSVTYDNNTFPVFWKKRGW